MVDSLVHGIVHHTVHAHVQGPRTALIFFKLDCETSLGEAADPEMQISEVNAAGGRVGT